jgi:hypothetical protein
VDQVALEVVVVVKVAVLQLLEPLILVAVVVGVVAHLRLVVQALW